MIAATITAADRLSVTVFLAAVAHALVILGIGFATPAAAPARAAPLIEITLADKPVEQAPERYDYLAQANQDGGGQSPDKQRPRRAEQGTMDGEPDGQQAVQTAPATARPAQMRQSRLVSAASDRPASAAAEAGAAAAQNPAIAVALIDTPLQVARWSAPQDPRDSRLARFPDKRRIDARTKSHHAAAYMHAWVETVERVGNLHYPEEARRRKLSGSLIIEVTVRPDGSLYDLRVLKPSGEPVLDQAALRTIHLAAPFMPVPDSVLRGDDLLVITRTWEFVDKTGLSTR